MAETTLIKNATVLSMDPTVGDLSSADILITGSIITDIQPSIPTPADCEVIDATGCIAIPGFVDCHRHSWEGIIRTVHPNSPTLDEYIKTTLGTFVPQFRPNDVYVGTRATAIAAIDAGITTIVDNMHCNRTPAHGSAAVKAWVESGLDAIVALEPAPWGQPAPPKADIKAMLAAHTAEIPASERKRVEIGVFGHFDRNEIEAVQESGATIVHEILQGYDPALVALDDQGWLEKKPGGSHFIFNHATSIVEGAWSVIKKLDGGVNVCPRSDAQWSLGGGFCAWDKANAHGIRPGISVDNELAYGGDMFSEMKVLFHTQRALVSQMAQSGDEKSVPEPVQVREILEAATVDGARAIGRADQVGRLAPGLVASVVLLRVDGPSHYPALTSVGQVVLSTDRSNVDTVIARGKILKRGGKLVGLDWDKVKLEMDESIAYLKKAINYQGSQITETFEVGKST